MGETAEVGEPPEGKEEAVIFSTLPVLSNSHVDVLLCGVAVAREKRREVSLSALVVIINFCWHILGPPGRRYATRGQSCNGVDRPSETSDNSCSTRSECDSFATSRCYFSENRATNRYRTINIMTRPM